MDTTNGGLRNMTEGSPARHIVLFALPLLAGSFLQQLYNLVDSWVVGQYVGDAALAAVGICPPVKDYLLASHISAEPAGAMVLKALGLKPAIQAGMCLGEGTGAAALFPLLDMAAVVYDRLSSFEEILVEQYEHLK